MLFRGHGTEHYFWSSHARFAGSFFVSHISVSSSPEPKASNYLRMNIPTKLFADAVLIRFLHLSSPYSAPLGERGNEGRKDIDVRRRGDYSGPLMVHFCLLFIFRE